ncbi:uncharacterized protein L969DRAFT_92645 [Mixia osmundae IAM 14324]|uniref:Polysaccharide biosynthesis domain-containing protein n=1 Tax=Mixia osmundae (strain CBS 9802 / IAM 14324 / JCM 22182 / KY 12970) TaxID=764103 RepID=G7DY53_MIXOS|nr:uncharacterized protein L969DRAFT_92645 [Mixia osmundae IAM 14324]KEI41415.1 hypothetical protein L969DRAFT_92645 [Mixia osmundae IAM 14324]GAA95513.1 hypothetical protein E5Q_02168 [Mixia osmundae IAM 14324]
MSVPADFDPENAGNAPEIEKQFAVKVIEQAQTHHKLITTIPPSSLKLTKHDDELYEMFKELFPENFENDLALVKVIDEDRMKNKDSKTRWQKYSKAFEKTVEDFSSGCLLRLNSEEDYTESNAIFAVRIQFLAYEITRNRHGLNNKMYEDEQKQSSTSKATA